ncbi:MAG: tRNA uridine-5-carboxymethylaminomethyl(34) synthesis GTPase MnmE [Desulfobacteraceae bacterium]
MKSCQSVWTFGGRSISLLGVSACFFLMIKAHLNEDTIAAIATPVGQAGIGIVRLSGSRALGIARKIFHPKRPVQSFLSHRLYLGYLTDPQSGLPVDEVLFSFMKAPHTYTREDVVEINTHSGHLLLAKILQIILNEGARLAKPGEFTFRAFMNGRIDLTQAEAIVDLINSQSERGLQLASQQIKGKFRSEMEGLRQEGLEILAHVEVAIDFPDEESGILPREETATRMETALIEPIEKIMAAHSQRKIWMEGINTVIVGRVNVGKSSLLNRLLNEQRAIVTPIPGTTRDIIESTVHIEGLPLRLMDTAGFRKVKGKLERIGIDLAERKLADADLTLIVIDQSRPLNHDDLNLIDKSQDRKTLVILNKSDLLSRIDEGSLKRALDGLPAVRISALTGEGIHDLRRAIRDVVLTGDVDLTSTHIAPNLRHKEALRQASEFFKSAARNIREGLPTEIIAMDLNSGLEALGEIIGATTNEELLDKIFSQFCLGK